MCDAQNIYMSRARAFEIEAARQHCGESPVGCPSSNVLCLDRRTNVHTELVYDCEISNFKPE